MQLIIDEFGTFIGKKENRFKIIIKEKKQEFSADKVSQIIVSSASSISTDAIKLAIENGIDIVYINFIGKPYARIYPCQLGGTTLTRRMQAKEYTSQRAADAVRSIVKSKIVNQINLLKYLSKARKDIDFATEIQKMSDMVDSIESFDGDIDIIRDKLLGVEGYAGNLYFSCLAKILPFEKREHEAKDPFNVMLNYGYGILYSEIEKVCVLAGLDPYLGFLHTDRYGKPSMVLDLIEEFRQAIVDRAIITVFARKQVEDSDFETSGNEFLLSPKGRKKVIEAVMERLHSRTKYKNRELSLQGIMLEQARLFAKMLLGQAKYDALVYKW